MFSSFLPQDIQGLISVCLFRFLSALEFSPPHSGVLRSGQTICWGDVVFGKNAVTLILKWSKTLQTRDQVRSISLPKLKVPSICPYKALRSIFQLYNPAQNEPLFQIPTCNGWVPLTDSRVRKHLAEINMAMNLPKNYYTFHAFRRSGASLAYHSNASIQQIKDHGTWTTECVWRYINMSAQSGREVADIFRKTIV